MTLSYDYPFCIVYGIVSYRHSYFYSFYSVSESGLACVLDQCGVGLISEPSVVVRTAGVSKEAGNRNSDSEKVKQK